MIWLKTGRPNRLLRTLLRSRRRILRRDLSLLGQKYAGCLFPCGRPSDILVALLVHAQSSPMAEPSRTSHPTTTTTSSRMRTSKSAPYRPSAPTAWGPVAPPASTAHRTFT